MSQTHNASTDLQECSDWSELLQMEKIAFLMQQSRLDVESHPAIHCPAHLEACSLPFQLVAASQNAVQQQRWDKTRLLVAFLFAIHLNPRPNSPQASADRDTQTQLLELVCCLIQLGSKTIWPPDTLHHLTFLFIVLTCGNSGTEPLRLDVTENTHPHSLSMLLMTLQANEIAVGLPASCRVIVQWISRQALGTFYRRLAKTISSVTDFATGLIVRVAFLEPKLIATSPDAVEIIMVCSRMLTQNHFHWLEDEKPVKLEADKDSMEHGELQSRIHVFTALCLELLAGDSADVAPALFGVLYTHTLRFFVRGCELRLARDHLDPLIAVMAGLRAHSWSFPEPCLTTTTKMSLDLL
ncbi:hypothetical protein HDU91_005313, partial [Kappamyces sp. JEL0680]